MKLITLASFKGGAGKTTALMAIAGAYAAEGKKVALFEADENMPLREWHRRAESLGTWEQSCHIFRSTDLASFERAFEEAEAAGYDVAIVDTHGGGSELNNTILISSDAIVIPTALTQLEILAAIDTFEYIVNLFYNQADYEGDAPAALLVQRLPTGRLTAAETAHLEILEGLPVFEAKMQARSAFADIASNGMLHLHVAKARANARTRISSVHLNIALEEAKRVAADIWDAFEGES